MCDGSWLIRLVQKDKSYIGDDGNAGTEKNFAQMNERVKRGIKRARLLSAHLFIINWIDYILNWTFIIVSLFNLFFCIMFSFSVVQLVSLCGEMKLTCRR